MYGFEMNHNEKLTPNEPKINPNEPKMTHNWKNTIDPKLTPNDPKMTPIDPKNIQNLKSKKICSYCGNSYSKNSHMRRFEKNQCKIKIK